MTQLPRGRVTLLFTDIEGSTALVQTLGPEYPIALARHRDLLREAVEGRQGVVLDTLGDETSNVFSEPAQAVAAAIEAQRSLTEHGFRVRMGIHTGEPSLAGGSYYGVDVHRAARIIEAGHGGQILASGSARGARSTRPASSCATLGAHELRGLAAPERGLPGRRRRARPGVPSAPCRQ